MRLALHSLYVQPGVDDADEEGCGRKRDIVAIEVGIWGGFGTRSR